MVTTSNAPTRGKKRRLSISERDHEPADLEEFKKKKIRSDRDTPEVEATPEPQQQSPTEEKDQNEKGVKEVTKGVLHVELNDNDKTQESEEVKPETVPLPGEEDREELEEGEALTSPPLDAQADEVSSSVDGETDDVPSDLVPKAEEKAPVEEEEEKKTEEAETTKAEAASALATGQPNP
ncbi:hypothetical protein H0H93_010811 [Arthromyces matolae]|nr:hypothetical protein H0H93_010811 [Arthromyces matolae]